ncbi:MAG: PEP-CTERM sorting domain-containing protein [Proteobacteria bacterium]|nr:PEP-CTERM sorting domain-containing protein [Pseudomonadota bacterium]
MKKSILISLILGLFLVHSASASTITWTDWQSATPGTVTGSMGSVGVTYTGNYSFAQLGTGENYWTEPNPGQEPYTGSALIDNAPTPSEMIALNSSATHTITFSEAVLNPVMAIVSMGRPSSPVSYAFNQPFSFLSGGVGYWSYSNAGNAGAYSILGNTLTGNEFHGAIMFGGPITSISWLSTPQEDWHGVTVGVSEVVPEPATMLLFGTGILGLAGAVRRRKK